MAEIIPVILAKDRNDFIERFSALEPLALWIQIDIVDGKFAPNITFDEPEIVAGLKTSVKFEIDLMVENPKEEIEKWLATKRNIGRIYFHWEAAQDNAGELIAQIKNAGVEAGLSINPETSTEVLMPFIKELDAVLFLGVSPGFGGQKLREDVIKKIESFYFQYSNVPIEVDGGVNLENAKALVSAGASRLASGSFIFRHIKGPAEAIKQLRNSIEL